MLAENVALNRQQDTSVISVIFLLKRIRLNEARWKLISLPVDSLEQISLLAKGKEMKSSNTICFTLVLLCQCRNQNSWGGLSVNICSFKIKTCFYLCMHSHDRLSQEGIDLYKYLWTLKISQNTLSLNFCIFCTNIKFESFWK